ncbi:MAG: DNA/RNA nuclease SfsA [Clostridia bacterium]|nr:DNA/RNA nuclease SfsA [Clostridia bacterium]
MKYQNLKSGKFIKRVNRFIAHVFVDNTEQIVHVKNTGRCKELLLPGVDVILEKSNNPGRKTRFSLIGVYKGDRLINVDSQVPTQVVFEALSSGAIQEIGLVEKIYEMIDAVKNGYAGYIFFLVQMKEVGYFTPNKAMDPDFTKALRLAAKKGVKILAYNSIVRPD